MLLGAALQITNTSIEKISKPKVNAFISPLIQSNLRPLLLSGFTGRNLNDRIKATITIGTFMANSHCQEATDKIPAAMVGPPAAETATTNALIPIPRPKRLRG